jgi:hypothetical protein
MTGFTKLFADIIDSTIWREDLSTKVVWITMLAKADKNGIVRSSVPGLADAARVSLPQCQDALQKFLSPDEWSRTKDHDGKRIMETDGGWILLNYQKYRKMRDEEETRIATAERVRKHREKHSVTNVTNVTPVTSGNAIAEAEAEAEAEATKIKALAPPAPEKRKRQTKVQKMQGFSVDVRRVVNSLIDIWPMQGTGGDHTSPTDIAIFGQRVAEILDAGNDPDLLIEAGKAYATVPRTKFSAPQFFFGKTAYGGKGEAPWVAYTKLILTKRENALLVHGD